MINCQNGDQDALLAQLSSIFEDIPLDTLSRRLEETGGVVSKTIEVLLRREEDPSLSKARVRKAPGHQTRLQLPGPRKIRRTSEAPGLALDTSEKSVHEPINQEDGDGTPGKSTVFNTLRWTPSADPFRVPRALLPSPKFYHRSEDVAAHTPCTLHHQILPKDLADRLLRTMLEESTGWKANEFWLFERKVTSSHTVSFYIRSSGVTEEIKRKEGERREGNKGGQGDHQAVQKTADDTDYWYNGAPSRHTRYFSDLMEEAARVIQAKVRQVKQGRPRFPYEESGPWEANVSAANCYATSSSSVGWHSDRVGHGS